MSDHTNLLPPVVQAITGLTNNSLDPEVAGNDTDTASTVEQAMTGLANISLDPDASGNDTDSTGSLPDLRPVGNNFRRGGAPYQVYGGRALNGEMIYDLIVRLQRLERALHGLADNAEQHWLPRHF
ncbi:hypothetical protein B0H13DRAFT_2352071 [Mycena leptocephala]|nr:hypothetical protein B0H13DRAFT_2352071 [Mycena leptocephala]